MDINVNPGPKRLRVPGVDTTIDYSIRIFTHNEAYSERAGAAHGADGSDQHERPVVRREGRPRPRHHQHQQ